MNKNMDDIKTHFNFLIIQRDFYNTNSYSPYDDCSDISQQQDSNDLIYTYLEVKKKVDTSLVKDEIVNIISHMSKKWAKRSFDLKNGQICRKQ